MGVKTIHEATRNVISCPFRVISWIVLAQGKTTRSSGTWSKCILWRRAKNETRAFCSQHFVRSNALDAETDASVRVLNLLRRG
jgi:hypothetical protein